MVCRAQCKCNVQKAYSENKKEAGDISRFVLGIHIVALWICLVTRVKGLVIVRYYEVV